MKRLMALVVLASLVFWKPALAESSSPLDQSRTWLVRAMKSWVPLSDHKIHNETEQEAEARYDSIASDALHVAFEPGEKPLFDGPYGRQRTSLLIVTIARYESNFIRRIDEGRCLKGECDNGAAACIMQVHTEDGLILEPDTYSYAHSKSKEWLDSHSEKVLTKDSLKDRKTCFRAALHKMRESLSGCRSVPKSEDRLGIYTGEGCNSTRPNPKSRTRIGLANYYFASKVPPVTDSSVLGAFFVN